MNSEIPGLELRYGEGELFEEATQESVKPEPYFAIDLGKLVLLRLFVETCSVQVGNI